ncbi:MAG: diaminopimelate epimerase [Bacteroidetes bacterium]|nr:diaminopimelate epimerase [Bacteroidota bacterium]
MQIIHFTKAEGAQNDFVIVDDRAGEIPEEKRRRFTVLSAHRRRGVGSDGAIFLDASETHDFRMSFYNPDGSVGSMCGNGGRCAALFAVQNDIAGHEMRFLVLDRSYHARVEGNTVQLSFPQPLEMRSGLSLECGNETCAVDYVDNGAPHVVLFASQLPPSLRAPLAMVDMQRVGSMLRHHAVFAPRGVNVNILEQEDTGVVAIRTFEKGVEGETEACGTGTLAGGMIAHLRIGASSPVMMRTHGGDLLRVHFTAGDAPPTSPEHYADDLMLEGPARLVFDGCFALPDA